MKNGRWAISRGFPTTVLMATAVGLSGCTSGLLDTKQPVQQTYVIAAGEAQPSNGAALDVDLAVARPLVHPGLYTDRITIRHEDRRLDYYSGSRWGATSDVVVQSLLVESLRNSARLSSVQSDMSAFAAQYLLQTELRDFQAEYAGASAPPTVRVGFVCVLGRIRAREPLKEYSASAQVQASNNTMGAVVTAFEQAYRQAAQVVVEETLAALTLAKEEDKKKEAR